MFLKEYYTITHFLDFNFIKSKVKSINFLIYYFYSK